MEILREQNRNNPNFVGYDEDHNGDWDNYYMCSNKDCDGFNYLTLDLQRCPMCQEKIHWID